MGGATGRGGSGGAGGGTDTADGLTGGPPASRARLATGGGTDEELCTGSKGRFDGGLLGIEKLKSE